MSIEYLGMPMPSLIQRSIDDLLDKLASSSGYRPVRQSTSELGLVSVNSDEAAPETITIRITSDEVYLAFHCATRDERDRLVRITQELLRKSGFKCCLDEL